MTIYAVVVNEYERNHDGIQAVDTKILASFTDRKKAQEVADLYRANCEPDDIYVLPSNVDSPKAFPAGYEWLYYSIIYLRTGVVNDAGKIFTLEKRKEGASAPFKDWEERWCVRGYSLESEEKATEAARVKGREILAAKQIGGYEKIDFGTAALREY